MAPVNACLIIQPLSLRAALNAQTYLQITGNLFRGRKLNPNVLIFNFGFGNKLR